MPVSDYIKSGIDKDVCHRHMTCHMRKEFMTISALSQ